MPRAAELMTRDLVTIGPDRPIGDAVHLLAEQHIRHLPVVDAAGVLVGILSDRDLRERSSGDVAPVADVMTKDVITARPDDDAAHLANLLALARIGAIPIVDGRGRLAGLVSTVDLLRAQARAGADDEWQTLEVIEPPPPFDPGRH